MEYALIAIIVIAVIAIIYLLVKLHEQKAYYRYIADKLSHTEEKSSRTIDDLKESVRGLKRELNTDITTKIGNRDYFIKKTLQLLERNPEHKYTIIGFSISNIELISKLFGPAEGDRLIRYTAEKLKERYQSKGLYALVQSNMFAMFLKGQDDEKIIKVIGDITEDIAKCFEFFRAEAVFGIYKIEDPTIKVSEMLSRLVLAQRSVTEDSKVNYAFFDMEMSIKYEENRNMCAQMEQALEQKEFVMYLQPL
ncbi:MAG: diguanylate cyclase, partial [Lachnospiraceae bacterium]|nr:diguanylate cyclase [Lachnospiraceae bacterium]